MTPPGIALQTRRRTGGQPEQPGWRHDRYVLRGEVEWVFTGTSDERNALVAALPGVCEHLGDIVLLSFGNGVGFFDIPGYGRVEVVSGKWDSTHFDRMLAELTDIASGLPFSADASTALPYDRSVVDHRDILYHSFVYLRHVLSDSLPIEQQLLPALDLVLREPHQRFDRTRRQVPLNQVRRLDPAGIIRLVGGDRSLLPVSAGVRQRIPLASALGGHLPERIDESYVDVTHDTAENRFVKAFIGMSSDIISDMRGVARSSNTTVSFKERLLSDCNAMDVALRPALQHGLWREVGPMVHLPASSPLLQRRRGYKEIYRHFAKLRLTTRLPLKADLMHVLLDAKDIATLYELWCFFTLVAMVQRYLGDPMSANGVCYSDTGVSVDRDFEVVWSNGTCLLYNPSFSHSKSHERHSYSVPLRPDIAIQISGGPNKGLHLFDAKFKVDRLDVVMSVNCDDEDVRDVADERRGIFKRGDLYKMHTYRDAIPCARSVWILYPGTDIRFFNALEKQTISSAESFPSIVQGVGAIPLLPDEEQHTAISSVIRHLLSNLV